MNIRNSHPQNDGAIDYYGVNDDWSGVRNILETQEVVDYNVDMNLRIWFNEQSASYNMHWHNALEIILPVENYYDIAMTDQDFHLVPGDIFIIPCGEMHALNAPESGKRFIFLFDMTNIARFRGFSSIHSLVTHALLIKKSTYPFVYDELYRILMQMRNEYFGMNNYREIVIYSLLMNFFVALGRNRLESDEVFPNVRIYKQKEYLQKFNDVLEFIDSHYMDDLSLESVSSSVGFSKYHFTRLFKQYTNSTFYDYLSFKRLKVAESLLEKPDLSITEIALQSGFSSISTFNRIFRQQKECTPSEYRALCSYSHHEDI